MRALVAVALLTACGGAATAPAPPGESPLARSTAAVAEGGSDDAPRAASATSTEARPPDGWRVAILPQETASTVGADAEGRWLVTHGGFRGRVENGGVEWADDVFATPILGAASVEHGWVFLTRDGMLWRAETYLGRATALRGFSAASSLVGAGCAAVVDGRGRVYWTDGDTVERAELPDGVEARGAACLGVDHRVVATAGEEAYVSHDGGEQWDALSPDEETGARGRGATVTLDAEGAHLRVGHDAARVPWPSGPPVPFHRAGQSRAARDASARARESLVQRLPFAVSAQERARENERAEPSVQGLPADCIGVPAAPLRFFTCFERRGEALYAVGDDGLPRRVGTAPPLPTLGGDAETHASVDGSALVYLGTDCSGRSTPGELALCVIDASSRRTTDVRLPRASRDYFVGAHGETLLLDGWRAGDLVTLVREGRPVGVSPPPGLSDARLRDLAIVRGGHFSATAVLSDYADLPDARGVLGDLDTGDVRALELPDGAMAVGFLDADRGVAAGPDLGSLWVTDDGGERWVPIRPDLLGAAEAVPLVGLDPYWCIEAVSPRGRSELGTVQSGLLTVLGIETVEDCRARYDEGLVECDRQGCSIHDRFRVGDAEHLPEPSGRLLAAPRGPFAEDEDEGRRR
ncbi:MAG TPA: hypothetical protein RMH99_17435 [Sandaracinaceae bacterium LLY-WYZ-13_1]|nr:hypothetical protein [Sandaracinaceae bacterium LLY-WYZ-13_1]